MSLIRIMERRIFLIILVVGLSSILYAQTAKQDDDKEILFSMSFVFSDTSNFNFFDKNPEVDHVAVTYKNDKPYFLFLSFNLVNGEKRSAEHYDMAFEGDVYMLKYKYGLINFRIPNFKVNYRYERKFLSVNHDHFWSRITKDSTVYSFLIDTANDERVLGGPAKYLGDISELESTLAKIFAERGNKKDVDSIVVFRGAIGKLAENNIRDIELVAGKPSAFSKLIQKELEKKTNFWRAAGIDRGPIETWIRIYARLNPNGSITIKMPRRLRTLSGE